MKLKAVGFLGWKSSLREPLRTFKPGKTNVGYRIIQ